VTHDAVLLSRCAWAWLGAPGQRGLRPGVSLLVNGGSLAAVDPRVIPPGTRIIDASQMLVMPGFVNGHHHLSQQLTKTRACGSGLIEWLCACYPLWVHMDAELAADAALAGVAEALLGGVTTLADFTYLYPRGHADLFDAQVAAARELGVRLYATRGGVAELEAAVAAQLGSAIEPYLEPVDDLLVNGDAAIRTHHDRGPRSMCRVALGLTEKTYGDPHLMQELASLAEALDVRLHTHLHPRPDEREHAASGGTDPIGFLREHGWWTGRLWVAHGTGLVDDELDLMVAGGVGLCTCPASNARFGTPIAPALGLARRGGGVGIGLDGAASSDMGSMLAECRLAWQVQRIRYPQVALEPEQVLEWATAGGATLLDWPQLGRLEVGGLADICCFDLSGVEDVGVDDPLAALLLCGAGRRAHTVIVDGRVVVDDGHLVHGDEREIAARARAAAHELASRSRARTATA
jgi:8-oxoguanine deaminase